MNIEEIIRGIEGLSFIGEGNGGFIIEYKMNGNPFKNEIRNHDSSQLIYMGIEIILKDQIQKNSPNSKFNLDGEDEYEDKGGNLIILYILSF